VEACPIQVRAEGHQKGDISILASAFGVKLLDLRGPLQSEEPA
jgi:hypothetical protein